MFVSLHKLGKTIQFGTIESIVISHSYWTQPEFGVLFRLFNMDMNGLISLIAKKEKSIPINSITVR